MERARRADKEEEGGRHETGQHKPGQALSELMSTRATQQPRLHQHAQSY